MELAIDVASTVDKLREWAGLTLLERCAKLKLLHEVEYLPERELGRGFKARNITKKKVILHKKSNAWDWERMNVRFDETHIDFNKALVAKKRVVFVDEA